MDEETVDHLRFIGLGAAGFCHLDNIQAVFRESRKSRWQPRIFILNVCYVNGEEYEFLYSRMAERDEAYTRLTRALPFLRLSSGDEA